MSDLADLLDAFEQERATSTVGVLHTRKTRNRAARVACLVGATRLEDFTAPAVDRALEAIPITSPRSREKYRLAVSAVLSWAIASGRLPGPHPLHKAAAPPEPPGPPPTPLEDTLAAFEAGQLAAGRCRDYTHGVRCRVARFARLASAVRLEDLTPERIAASLPLVSSKPSVQRKAREDLSAVFSWARAAGLFSRPNPAACPRSLRGTMYRKPWRDRDGNRREGATWYAQFRDDTGRLRTVALGVRGSRDEAARELERVKADGVETRRAVRGTLPRYTFADVPAPLGAIVEEYLAELRRLRRSPAYLADVARQLLRVLVGTAAKTIEEVTSTLIAAALAALGGSAYLQNAHRRALVSFYEWLIRNERWDRANPARRVRRVKHETDRVRRALSEDDISRLLAAAPADRAAVYRVALDTGLRMGELAALRVADVNVDAGTVVVRASVAKSGKRATLPLRREAVEALRPLVAERKPDENVFPTVPTVETFYADLRRAGIDRETGEGVCDRHAMRVTYATRLQRRGVELGLAQKLLRHSSPVLTANIYSRFGLGDLRAAVARLDEAGTSQPLTSRGGQVDDARADGMGPIVLRAVV